MVIRPENREDAAAIRRVNARAFDGEAEPALVEAIRASDGFIPELSLVAVDGVEVVGHVMLSRVALERDEGADPAAFDVLCLAPLAVVPERQRQGIGSSLTERALADADREGWPLVVLLGHPTYYPRFGFVPASQLGIRPPNEVRDEVFMARRLSAYRPEHRGTIRYPLAFEGVT
jgi:putative acetyltransferase